MSRSLTEPFTEAEMQAIRRAASGEDAGAHADEAHVRKHFWGALKRIARNTPFAQDLVAAFYCARDSRTPLKVRMILFGALGYFILPLDAVSDLLPLVGFTDDIAVLTLAIATVSSAIRPEHRGLAAQALSDQSPSKGSAPFIDGEEPAPPRWKRWIFQPKRGADTKK